MQPGQRSHTRALTRTATDLFIPNADTACRLLTGGAVACRLTCVFVLVDLGE